MTADLTFTTQIDVYQSQRTTSYLRYHRSRSHTEKEGLSWSFQLLKLSLSVRSILNVIVYFSRVPTRKDLNDLRIELRNEIRESRNEMNVRFSKLDEALTRVC